jgi:uncharacterized protein DUF4328
MAARAGADSGRMESAEPAAGHLPHRVADPEDPPREMSGLAWGAMVSLGLLAIVGLIRIGTAVNLQAVAGDDGDVESAYGTYTGFVVLHELLFLLAAGAFIAWFFRAYTNLRRLGVENMRYRTGWAIGSWFIPIFNWFRPKHIANDVWRGSERGVDVSTRWRRVAVPNLVHWWWGLFLVQGLLLQIGQKTSAEGYDKLTSFASYDRGLTQLKSGAVADIIGGACSLAAAVLAIMVVRRISKRLDRIREDVLSATP